MKRPKPIARLGSLAPYVPGLSIREIQDKYGLSQVIKLASNENPLGASPYAVEVMQKHADMAFRYPQGGNPRLAKRLAKLHNVETCRIVVGNGSDELIDLLIRTLTEAGTHNIVCNDPCFSIYPIQARINGTQCRRVPLLEDFSFDFDNLLAAVDENTRLVFLTTPDNPSGYCPLGSSVEQFSRDLAMKNPQALLVIDEAYMDFSPNEKSASLIDNIPHNAAILRTFSKSYGLAGLRIGYAILPENIAQTIWSCRLPFSLNIMAEEAALAALEDDFFRAETLKTVNNGRRQISEGLTNLGCHVWPSSANFIMFSLPHGKQADACFQYLLERGIIIRPLKSYNLPDNLRVSIGTERENSLFLHTLGEFLA